MHSITLYSNSPVLGGMAGMGGSVYGGEGGWGEGNGGGGGDGEIVMVEE